jgi:hypothetical protein
MDKDKSMLSLAIITAFIAMAVILPGLIHAGDLEPPGPPGSTMHTLDEIYNNVDDVVSGYCNAPAPVGKTGQTISQANGDDGDLRKGVAWPNPRFTDNGDGTVTDNLTRLIWLKNAHRFGSQDWWGAVSACNSLADDGSELTDGSVAGDWRLPNVNELHSLEDYDFYEPALPNTAGTGQWTEGDPFTNVQFQYYYWSSTPYVWNSFRWAVSMKWGTSNYLSTSQDYHYVWPVRGGND